MRRDVQGKMESRVAPRRAPVKTNGPARQKRVVFPAGESPGYLVRDAHRAFQNVLEKRIAPFGVTRGQWYFLRVLWDEDGLSQRELSTRVGMMEPTTVIALNSMAKAGLIDRVRSAEDRRKTHVWLTAKAQKLRNTLLPVARGITEEASAGIAKDELATFRKVIARLTVNLDRAKR